MSAYRLKILTPEKKLFDGDAISLLVQCEDGQLAVLAGHAPMVAMLTEGSVFVQTDQAALEGIAGPGMLHVSHTETAVLVHAFQWITEEDDAFGQA